MTIQTHKCQNCSWTGDADHCGAITDLEQRVSPGEFCPVGECPQCGALVACNDEDLREVHGFVPDEVRDALKAAQCPVWVHNAAVTNDIEALRGIALWHANWWNITARQALGQDRGQAQPLTTSAAERYRLVSHILAGFADAFINDDEISGPAAVDALGQIFEIMRPGERAGL